MINGFSYKNEDATNAFLNDNLLVSISSRLPSELAHSFKELGNFVNTKKAKDLARLANAHSPIFHHKNCWGKEQPFIEMHPAYHALLRRSKQIGLSSSLWDNNTQENGFRYQTRALRLFLMAGLENGHLSEIISTNAGIIALASSSTLYERWKSVILSREHDSTAASLVQKKGASLAFAFEGNGNLSKAHSKQYIANPLPHDKRSLLTSPVFSSSVPIYQINAAGSRVINANADAFFVSAYLEGQLSCFLVPYFYDNGIVNGIKINYLIEEAGYKSCPVAQVDFNNSFAWLVGEIGAGGKVIEDVETLLRFDEAIIAAGNLRAALAFALAYLKQNGENIPQLTLRVFADMALDIAAAEALVMRIAYAFDHATQEKNEAAYAHVMAPIAAFWINNLVSHIIGEILVHLDPAAYEENAYVARLFKDSCVRLMRSQNANKLVEDVIQSARKAPKLFQELIANLGSKIQPFGEKTAQVLYAALQIALNDVSSGRLFLEQFAYTASLAALNDLDFDIISTAFAESRLGGQWRSSYGMLSARYNVQKILETLYPL